MYLHWIVGLSAFVWFLLEHPQIPKPIRATVQPLICVLLVLTTWGASSVLGRMSMRLEANNMVKNLTRGLVTITTSDHDPEELRERLVQLNDGVVPTYETTLPTRMAVEEFLATYSIGYEAEISVE